MRLNVDGCHVDVHEGRGPYLLLMHGFLSSRGQWAANIPGLQAFCRPVTFELLGHGRSDHPPGDAPYTLAAYLARFEAVRTALGVEDWFICGQSFGAGLTLNYAIAHPQRIRGQIFTNTNAALSTQPPGGMAPEARAAALLAGGQAALEGQRVYPKPMPRVPEPYWAELVGDAAGLNINAVAQAMRVTIPDLNVLNRMDRIVVPTLLVNGRRETRFQRSRDIAAEGIKGIEIVDLEGGHSVNIHDPLGFNRAVEAFIARVESSALRL